MQLSKNNQTVVDALRDKQLNYLVKPFKQLVELDKLEKIKVHKMTWKSILNEAYNGSRLDLENTIISYLVNFGVFVAKKKRVDKRISKERVKKHREDKKALGYKTVSFELSPKVYNRLQKFKSKEDLTYADAIELLLSLLPK